MFKNIAKLMRVKHYIKNLLIFFPLTFGKQLFEGTALIRTFAGFAVFSFVASAIYIINDMNDIEADRRHPQKCKRPLASGAVSVSSAKVIFVVLVIVAAIINYVISGKNYLTWLILAIYVLSNFIYSFGGKHVALLDVSILALGYVLRVYYGAIIIGSFVSSWLYITVLSMSFFLGFGKRRNELKMQGIKSRKVLEKYSFNFLDKIMYLCLGLTITFYSLWCESFATESGNDRMLLTIPLMALICFRYCMDIEAETDGDPVEVVVSDKPLLIVCTCYGVMMLMVLYADKLIR